MDQARVASVASQPIQAVVSMPCWASSSIDEAASGTAKILLKNWDIRVYVLDFGDSIANEPESFRCC